VPSNRPTLAIVGAGRTGRALGRALRRRGWRIGAVVSRTAPHARAAARAIGAGTPRTRLDPGILAADIILITTPDRSIAAVAAQLASIAHRERAVAQACPGCFSGGARGPGAASVVQNWRRGALRISRVQRRADTAERRPDLAGKIILHASGALDRSALAPLERLGAATGSLHPLQTFGARGVTSLEGCICSLEGAPAALRTARRMARDLGCLPVVIAPQAKPAYHAAGALAAGHILAVIEAATRILMALGFSRREAVRALLPLTCQTLVNFERYGATAAWTGPLARGDFATVRKHAAALRRFPRQYRDAYAALSRLALFVLSKKKERRRTWGLQ
jgi:predicted short-subunit dehydrogenase-like oxidoreductase (DUF2520 family)